MNHQKIGYARVSTADQNLERQLDLLLRGGSCVAFRNLTPLLEWLKKQEG